MQNVFGVKKLDGFKHLVYDFAGFLLLERALAVQINVQVLLGGVFEHEYGLASVIKNLK